METYSASLKFRLIAVNLFFDIECLIGVLRWVLVAKPTGAGLWPTYPSSSHANIHLSKQNLTSSSKRSSIISLNLIVPERWEDLSDKQLRYVYQLIADKFNSDELKTLCLLHWSKLKQSANAIMNLNVGTRPKKFIDKYLYISDIIAKGMAPGGSLENSYFLIEDSCFV